MSIHFMLCQCEFCCATLNQCQSCHSVLWKYNFSGSTLCQWNLHNATPQQFNFVARTVNNTSAPFMLCECNVQ